MEDGVPLEMSLNERNQTLQLARNHHRKHASMSRTQGFHHKTLCSYVRTPRIGYKKHTMDCRNENTGYRT